MKQVSLILEPGQIGSMKLKNRFVMAAMGHGFCDETDGYVSDRLIEFFPPAGSRRLRAYRFGRGTDRSMPKYQRGYNEAV